MMSLRTKWAVTAKFRFQIPKLVQKRNDYETKTIISQFFTIYVWK